MALKYRALDKNGDMVIGNQNAYLEGREAVAQAIGTRLRMLVTEWWEQLEDGIPYWQQIIGTRDKDEAVRLIRKRIEQTDRVIAVLVIDSQWSNETRELTINAGVETEYGRLVINEVFGA